jgi:hypothetical protein
LIEPGSVEMLVNAITAAIDIDSAGAATAYGNIDTGAFADVSIDSLVFADDYLKKPQLSAFNSDHKLAYFNNTPMTAIIETAETQIFPGQRSLVTNVRPMIEGASTVTVEVGSRDATSDSVSYSDSYTVNSYGEANLFASGRYQRARVTITGGFDHAYGIEPSAVPAGRY